MKQDVMPSSVVASFDYEEDTEKLFVKFVSGDVYEYLKVPLKIYKEMKAATSKGRYLNFKIKPNYEGHKVEYFRTEI